MRELPGAVLKDTQLDEYYEDEVQRNFHEALIALRKNPYPGLRPFKTSESIVFFGRKEVTFDLMTRLANHRFMAVLGASGSGKSSLVRAGLLPGLKTLPGKHGLWKIAICRPGKNPFGNLSRAIHKSGIAPAINEAEIWKFLSSSSYGFEELFNQITTPKNFNTLIVIDQFEELFRFRNDFGASGRNDAALFVKMLIDISRIEDLNAYVIITMRSEYLGDCVKFSELVEVINEGQFLIPRLKFKQLRGAIREPAGFSGASVDQEFADKLIGEIGDNMDQLPVLQHALRRSFEEAKQKKAERGALKVIYEDYKETGLMENALDKHANEIYASLTENQKQYCKELFQCITDRASDGRGIRRPLSFSRILEICKETVPDPAPESQIQKELITTIDAFRQESVNFLMPQSHIEISEDTEIDISHESLMRIWNRLTAWIVEESKDAILLNELVLRDSDEYFNGSKLLIYTEWLSRKNPGLKWASLYRPLNKNTEEYNARVEAGIALIKKSKKREKYRLIKLLAVSGIIFISLAAAFIINYKYSQLKDAELVKTRQNVELSLANREKEILNQKLMVSNQNLHISNQNLNISNQEVRTINQDLNRTKERLELANLKLTKQKEDLFTSRELLVQNEKLLRFKNEEINTANLSLRLTQDSLITASDSATNLKNLALAIRHSEKSLAIPVFDTARENIKAHLALASYYLYLQSGPEHKNKLQDRVYAALYFALRNKMNSNDVNTDYWQVTSYDKESDHVAVAAGLKGNSTVYLTAEDRFLYHFDLGNQDKNKSAAFQQGHKIVGIEASAKGDLAVNTLSNKIVIIGNANLNDQKELELSGTVRTMKFSPDGSILYAYTQDSVMWSINVADQSMLKQKLAYRLEDIAISNSNLYGLSSRGEVISWGKNKTSFTDPVSIFSDHNKVTTRGIVINCNPNNSLVIWGNENGQVFYLDNDQKKTVQYLTKFSGPVTSIAFNAAYNFIAIASYNKTIQVFTLPNLQSDVPLTLDKIEGPVTSVFFQKNTALKESLVAVISPGTIRVYPMDLETLACKLFNLYKNKQPKTAEWNMYADDAIKNLKVNIPCK